MHFIQALACALSLTVSVSALAISDIKDALTSLTPRDPRPSREQETDGLLFLTPMSGFLAAKRARQPARLHWDDNGCTGVPDKPSGFNFLPSCQRHDFGYSNYKIQKRCSEAERKKIDDNFKKDMDKECSKYAGLQAARGVQCRAIARGYYEGVRKLGESRFC